MNKATLKGDPGVRPGFCRADRDRSGIALVVVLGFLTLLTILAVSFAISMRTERMSSNLHVQATQARHLTHVAVARAMQDIEGRLGWLADPNTDRYINTPMAPQWSVMSSTGTATQVDLATGVATNYLPGITLIEPDGVTNPTNTPKWAEIVVDGQIIGRYAYEVVDCSGLVDITAINQQQRNPTYVPNAPGGRANVGSSPMIAADPRGIQISPGILQEFGGSAANVTAFLAELSNNWGRVESMAELRQLLRQAGCNPPQHSFFYSYAPNHEWFDKYDQVVRPRTVIGTNEAAFRANETDILNGLSLFVEQVDQRAGRPHNLTRPYIDGIQDGWASQIDPRTAYDAILNYIDADWIPEKVIGTYSGTGVNSVNCEPVPMITEIIFSNHIGGVTNAVGSTWTNNLDVYVELANLSPITNERSYQLEVQITSFPASSNLKVNSGGYVVVPLPSPWKPNEYRVWPHKVTARIVETLAAASARPPSYSVIARVKDMSGIDAASGTIVDIANGIVMAATDAIGKSSPFNPPFDEKKMTSKTPFQPIMGHLANWLDSQYRIRTESVLPVLAGNWETVVTPGFYNREGFMNAGDTNGTVTWFQSVSRSQDRIDTIGELHRCMLTGLSSGEVRYWSFRDGAMMAWPPAAAKPVRDYQLHDRFVITTNVPTRGTINPNTRYSNVLAQVFVGWQPEWFAGIRGSLTKAIMYAPPGLMDPNLYEWQMSDWTYSDSYALRTARRLMVQRDVVLLPPYVGPASDTIYQYMNWGDAVDSVIRRWNHKWGTSCGRSSQSLVWVSTSPHLEGGPLNGVYIDVDWDNLPQWRGYNLGTEMGMVWGGNNVNGTLGWEINGAWGVIPGQWFELHNPRQNIFTILVAAQAIAPKPAGSGVSNSDVMSERRAVLVVWRDPWPTADDGDVNANGVPDRYDRLIPKSQRKHRSFVKFFKWLDE
jgi:hypothetical protein